MSIEIIGEVREGSASIRKSAGKLVYEDEYTFIVQTDSNETSRLAVLAAPGIPRPGWTRSAGGFAVCQTTTANRDPVNPKIWRVQATFSSEVDEDKSGADESQSGDPTSWVPIAELGFETYTEQVKKDINGVVLKNSAGQRLAGSVDRVRTLVRFDFDQFEPASTTSSIIAGRNETVNAGVFFGKQEKTLKLTVKSATLGYYFGYKVWKVSYSLLYKPDTWIFYAIDEGNTYIDNQGNLVKYTDDSIPPNRIVGFLNGAGGKLAAGSDPVALPIDIYEAINFSQFLRVR